MIDIPWTNYEAHLHTESEAYPTGFSDRRAQFRVIDDWCEVQYWLSGNDDFTKGNGAWLLELPFFSRFSYGMDKKIIGDGHIVFPGSPLGIQFTCHAYEGFRSPIPYAARYALLVASDLIFVSSSMSGTPENMYAQLAYRAHVDGYFGEDVEDAINAQHEDVLEFGVRVDWDVP